jgi:hypothetical protein
MCRNDHEALKQRADALVTQLLHAWQFSPMTQVAVQVLCCEDTEAANFYGAIRWGYLPYEQFVLRVRCDTAKQIEHLVRHELLEAVLAEYAEFTEEVMGKKTSPLADWQHRTIRDRVIERLLAIIAPEFRPPPEVRA